MAFLASFLLEQERASAESCLDLLSKIQPNIQGGELICLLLVFEPLCLALCLLKHLLLTGH